MSEAATIAAQRVAVDAAPAALRLRVRGVVQGVGFRPFVHRLALRHRLRGWVVNDAEGVLIHLEGDRDALSGFVDTLVPEAPAAALVAEIECGSAGLENCGDFSIRESVAGARPTARISPDLAACDDCIAEMLDARDRRFHYPYINCTSCGPRYSIVRELPYDRARTTMASWPMCPACAAEYHDQLDRRFHAQPAACPDCGPRYYLRLPDGEIAAWSDDAIARAVTMLRDGKIVAVKGIGGYHLACDASNDDAVRALRERKFRREQPFAVMARDLATARRLVDLVPAAADLLGSPSRPIVLAARRRNDAASTPETASRLAPEVAPENTELGVMLPYAPLHVLLFEHGAPDVLVMTSANRSSEPIAFRDDDAFDRLAGICDAFLAGERPIARRVDDSVARVGPFGPMILRRARGIAPGGVCRLDTPRPILAVGADLKNSITLAVGGQAVTSQHIGDLSHLPALESFRATIDDLLAMYDVPRDELLVVHDLHPDYASTQHALELPGEKLAVQHHRAHVASVLAEHGLTGREIVGIALDGTGYGDDGGIWGGEVFCGSVRDGFERVAHLVPALLPGGDAAARMPVQAAAGFLAGLERAGEMLPDMTAPPFEFPAAYGVARQMARSGLRTFETTSCGRLFDTVAALAGFTRRITFEGQAAIRLEQLAAAGPDVPAYPFPDLDYRPLLRAVIADRIAGRPVGEIARAFHRAVADAVLDVGAGLCRARGLDLLILSGGVFQNRLLLDLIAAAGSRAPRILVNRQVPPNDGGVSLGQAAMAAAWSRR
jgi:hydrogenase maturation protein HypF